MSRICPVDNRLVIYPYCMECENKVCQNIQSEEIELNKKSEKIVNESDN